MSQKQVKEIYWNLLISHGAVVKTEDPNDYIRPRVIDFYGSCVDADEKKTKEFLDKARTHGIDWEKTETPRDDFGFGFAGTFAEEQDRINYVYGTVFLNDGSKYLLASKVDGFNVGFAGLINMMINIQYISLEESLENLEKRIADGFLRYSAEMSFE